MSVTISGIPTSSLSADERDRWRRIPVSVAVDLNDSIRQIDPAIHLLQERSLLKAGGEPVLFGRAVTVRCEPPDFGAVLYALDHVGHGDVLVIAAAGFADNAMIGEILGGHLRSLGAAGVVCDGAIRDTATLANWSDLPVYCRSITARGPVGADRGAVNVPVMIAGTEVKPGELILGDADGLAVLSDEELRTWIDAAEARLETEANWARRLSKGESVAAVFNLPVDR